MKHEAAISADAQMSELGAGTGRRTRRGGFGQVSSEKSHARRP